VRIQVDPESLASMGLGPGDVRAALTTVTTDSPKAALTPATRTFTINANDSCLSAEPWNDVIVAYRRAPPCVFAMSDAPSKAGKHQTGGVV